jgi:hypothetical protein
MKGAPAAAPVAIEARTFQQDADEFLRIRSARLKPSSRRYWLYTFGRYPELLQKPVAEVSEADILTALAPRTDEGTEFCRRTQRHRRSERHAYGVGLRPQHL